MEHKKMISATFAFGLALVLVPAVASAQGMGAEQGAQPAQPTQQAPAAEFSDAEVEQFTEAYAKVEQIGQELNETLAGVQDPEEAREIQQEGYEKMHAAVQETGMDAETYNGIAAAINTDPQLQARVMEKLGR